MDYTSYVNQIATMAVVPANDPNFIAIIPSMINYAELRLQRDLDFLSTQFELVSTSTYTVANSPLVQLDQSLFVTVQTITCQSSGFTSIDRALIPVTKEFIQNVYNISAYMAPTDTLAFGQPKYFAMYGGNQASSGGDSINIILGPCPNDSYRLFITGTQRFVTLSVDNPTNYISLYLPDLLIMASMIYVSAYQRNFGRINDDPQMAQTYESQYQALLKGATVEEFRKKFQSSGWAPYSPSPIATPSR
jgi:hypothetical protein